MSTGDLDRNPIESIRWVLSEKLNEADFRYIEAMMIRILERAKVRLPRKEQPKITELINKLTPKN